MRIFRNFIEAQNEIKRDLAELGVQVHPETMQDKVVKDDPDFDTKELANYIYAVTKPDYAEIEGTHDEWIKQEWLDRVAGGLNPGLAYRKRRDVWEQFLEHKSKEPHFSYTYSVRMGGQYLEAIVDELITHPNSRQLFLPVWDRNIDWERLGKRRVPCSLGYWFVQRDGRVHLTYMMRSCDFFTHYPNDVALATILQHYVAAEADYKVGTFTHFVGSLHIYAKDVANVF
jgi:thymidylate synthase